VFTFDQVSEMNAEDAFDQFAQLVHRQHELASGVSSWRVCRLVISWRAQRLMPKWDANRLPLPPAKADSHSTASLIAHPERRGRE
jgi:hypothetical protein